MAVPASLLAKLGRAIRSAWSAAGEGAARRARVLVAGALLAFGVLAIGLPVLTTNTGCSAVETSPAPDAALPPCRSGPFIFCEPAAGEAPSCNTDDGTSRWLTRLPRSTRYPVGCVIDFVGERDRQGDCELEAVCKCLVPETGELTGDAGGAADAGDAGDAADAGDARAPDTSPRPTWNCFP
jgi:hypothetical protein